MFLTKRKKYLKKIKLILNSINLTKTSEEFNINSFNNMSLENRIVDIIITFKKLYNIDIREQQLLALFYLLENRAVVEMVIGEGKTYVIAMYSILQYYKTKEKVYIASSSEYLSNRDYEDCRDLYEYYNLSSSYANYETDIVYNLYSNFMKDYLLDMFTQTPLQSNLTNIIVDEIDAILLDQAVTPITISDKIKVADSTDLINVYNTIKTDLKLDQHYTILKNQVNFTENGLDRLEHLFQVKSIYDNLELLNSIEKAILVKETFVEGRDFSIKIEGDLSYIELLDLKGNILKNKILIDGLQQMLEASNNCVITAHTEIVAKINYKEYFDLFYNRVGLTGTCYGESIEFTNSYNLLIEKVKPHHKNLRIDNLDIICNNKGVKYNLVLDSVKKINSTKQPIIIVAHDSLELEHMSKLLDNSKLSYQKLEGHSIIEDSKKLLNSGDIDQITLVSSLIGRGVDIRISDEVNKLGGIYLISLSKNLIRREDEQLRGRVGRLGLNGETQFFLSLEDNLLKNYGSKPFFEMYKNLNYSKDYISSKRLNSIIEKSQLSAETDYYNYRKNILQYHDVYSKINSGFQIMRDKYRLVSSSSIFNKKEELVETLQSLKENYVSSYELLDLNSITKRFEEDFNLDVTVMDLEKYNSNNNESTIITNLLNSLMSIKYKNITDNQFNDIVSRITIFQINQSYKDVLGKLEILEDGINFRSLSQKDPITEFQKEAFTIFERELISLKLNLFINLLRVD